MTIQGIFAEQICEIKKKSLLVRKQHDTTKPIATWIEKDHLLIGPGYALVLILHSRGCKWGLEKQGGCSMCGYSNETSENVSTSDLIAQIDNALRKFNGKKFQAVKIFNSGSFLDEAEIPKEAQTAIFKNLRSLVDVSEIIIESRPEFISTQTLKALTKLLRDDQKLEIGIGLESSSDFIRINNVNKGFLFGDYMKAVDLALHCNVRVKSYLLFKPPFLTEREAIQDLIQSGIDAIKAGSRSLSINPVNIQKGTFVHALWKNGLYRTPWFWSVKEAIQELWHRIAVEGLSERIDRILTDPSGAGTERGVHNCRKCNKHFSKLLREYSHNQSPSILDKADCSCYALWKELLSQEQATQDYSLSYLETITPPF